MRGAAALLVATACGSAGQRPATQSPPDVRSITHKYGTTEVSGTPTRVVSAGLRDHEHMLALGIQPVGVRGWYGTTPDLLYWPWAEPVLDEAEPTVVGGANEIDFERVATLEPDLITTVYSGVTRQEYERLSRIAPTIAQSGDFIDYGMPWQAEVRLIARALGREDRGDELVGEVEAEFARARRRHPEFAGATVAVGQLGEPGQYWILNSEDHKARFFTALGLEVPDEIDEAVGERSNLQISEERLDLFDRDVLVWLAGSERGYPEVSDYTAAVKGSPVYRQLDVVEQGRDVFLGLAADAIAWSSPLSLSFALEEAVPQLAAALPA